LLSLNVDYDVIHLYIFCDVVPSAAQTYVP